MKKEVRTLVYDDELHIEAYRFEGIVQPFPNHFHEYYVIGFMEDGERVLSCKNQEYTITQHECRLTRHSFDNTKGISYPEYSQSLLYSISPSLAPELYDIIDCCAGDTPRMSGMPDRTCSHTAAFACAPSPASDKRLAMSSFHFERFFSEVRWRLVFYVTQKPALEVRFPIL